MRVRRREPTASDRRWDLFYKIILSVCVAGAVIAGLGVGVSGLFPSAGTAMMFIGSLLVYLGLGTLALTWLVTFFMVLWQNPAR